MDKQLLLSAKVQDFIRAHESADLNTLLLQRDKYPDLPLPEIADQIKARKKARLKLPSWYKKKGILYPKPVSVEQASSEITAQWKANYIGDGKSGIDLTGGLGVDSYYFARHFEQWTHVEPNSELHEVVRHNSKLLSITNVNYFNLSSEDFLDRLTVPVDLIYLDPDRRPTEQRVAGLKDSQPDIIRLLPKLEAFSSQILVKASPMIDITAALSDLNSVKTVLIISIDNEVKEVLFHLDFSQAQNITIRCIDLKKDKEIVFNYLLNKNTQEEINISILNNFLFEPNAAIMKARGQDILASRHGLAKLHRNTNLYTAEQAVANYPGRVFRVIGNLPYKKKALGEYLTDGRANISTRNFIDTPEQMKRKIGVQDGGDIYLFGYRNNHNKNMVAVCKKELVL